jgi:hypothetical protein
MKLARSGTRAGALGSHLSALERRHRLRAMHERLVATGTLPRGPGFWAPRCERPPA